MSMYIIQKNNVITMNRGDTLRLSIPLYKNRLTKERVEVEDEDIIFFGLMLPHQHFECAFLKKEFDLLNFDSEGNFILSLEPLETMNLTSGVYYYELKLLKHSDDSITTLIPKTQFNIVD